MSEWRTPSKNLPWLRSDNRIGDVFNEVLRGIDALLQPSVISRVVTTPPGSPAQGDTYIVGAGSTGVWASKDYKIASYWGDEWAFYTPVVGWLAWSQADSKLYYYNGSTWALAIPGGGDALTTSPLSQFAATTSLQLAGVMTDETGTGALVFATSPTLVTPNLGTPASGTLTNCTGLPVATGIAGLGTGVATFLTTPSSANLAAALTDETGSGANVFATSPTLVTPLLGTPTSGVLTNCTGLPVSTGLSGLGAGVATFLATPSSANLLAAVTDETGTGALVFATSPTLVTPLLGTPTSGTLTNCTGLPVSTGISGLAAGVATFLATPTSANLATALTDETGSGANVFATSPTLVTPLLGTPTSGVLTNCTGLPISTGVSGLAAGIATFLATPSSANLIAAMTDETGTGALVFGTSPTLTTPTITVCDNAFTMTDQIDTSKVMVFELSGITTLTTRTLTAPDASGTLALTNNKLSAFAATTSAELAGVISDDTGSGALVFATSPTLVTPLLGIPTSGTLTNCTGLPISTGVSGLGAGVATFLATPSSANLIAALTDETGTGANVFATSPTLVTPLLGTPTSGTLTNCTGLPISTGVSGLGTNIATFLATPSSANLIAAITDETGSGALVFATSPTLVTPVLGTPGSGTLTNCTGLPISTGVSGLGTNVAAFLATPSSANLIAALTDETGTGALVFATSPTLVTPLLGTPTSGTLTNCTGLPTAGLVDDAVTNAKLANMATQTFKGRTTAGTGDPEDLTATQATAILNTFVGDTGSGGTKGLVPAPVTGDSTKFLRGDGAWITISGGGDALTSGNLSQFAATSSLQLKGVISDETGSGALVFGTSPGFTTAANPISNDGAALGTAALQWSDLFLATGGVVSFASTDWVATHTTGILTVGTGDLRVTTAGTNSASVVTVGGTQTLTAKTLTSPTLTTPVLGTPSSGTLTSCTGLPLTGLVSDTTTALGIGSINLGHASDTTIARVSAGVVSIEGSNIITAATYTAADVLAKLLTVDGASSGLDADLLDGYSSASFTADVQDFSASGTWTKPSTGNFVLVELWGGGGGGANGLDSASTGAGGGGGGYASKWFQASELSGTETVTVGGGGTAGSSASGGVGGTSTFKGVNAYGGGGGGSSGGAGANAGGGAGVYAAGPSSSVTPADGGGGAGGSSSGAAGEGGNFWAGGGGGGGGNAAGSGGRSFYGGGGGGGGEDAGTARKAGGTSVFGGAGGTGGYNADKNGTAGTYPGGGGGGASDLGTAGAGAGGRVRVTTF